MGTLSKIANEAISNNIDIEPLKNAVNEMISSMDTSTLSARIRCVISCYGETATDFAKKLNISQSMVSKICSGKANPSARTIADISRIYGVNQEWLSSGEGDSGIKCHDLKTEQKVSDKTSISIGDLLSWKQDDYIDIGLAVIDIVNDIVKEHPKLLDFISKKELYIIVDRAFSIGYSVGYKDGEKSKSTE